MIVVVLINLRRACAAALGFVKECLSVSVCHLPRDVSPTTRNETTKIAIPTVHRYTGFILIKALRSEESMESQGRGVQGVNKKLWGV